jgi:hypothetical protein
MPKVVAIKMIIGPARCAICGAPGDVWEYGKVVSETSDGAYWNGVVCYSCARAARSEQKEKNNSPYKNMYQSKIKEKIMITDDRQYDKDYEDRHRSLVC